MADHKDSVVEAARTIDGIVKNSDTRAHAINDVNAYLTQNPTLVSDSGRSAALSNMLAAKGDLPDLLVGEYTKANHTSDPLAQLLGNNETVLGSSDTEIQKNAKIYAEGLAAAEGTKAFTKDQWNQIFNGDSAGHDDIKRVLNDTNVNLTTDQRKALTDIEANFNGLRTSAWKVWDAHNVSIDKLYDDLYSKDDGVRSQKWQDVQGLMYNGQDDAKAGNVSVNVEAGEGWQNIAAKALGYDVRLRTQNDWSYVPQTDVNKIYGLANYFSQKYPKDNPKDTMIHPGQLDLTVPEKFQTT